METTTHTYQAGEYSPRAGRRVCALCGETQGSKFHNVPAPTADIKCGCEHAKHFSLEEVPEFSEVPRNGHAYLGTLAGEQNSAYVGPVCDRCWVECLGH